MHQTLFGERIKNETFCLTASISLGWLEQPVSEMMKGVLTRVPFEFENIQCVAGGRHHSVIIEAGCLFASGDGREFASKSSDKKIFEKFIIFLLAKVRNIELHAAQDSLSILLIKEM